MMNIRPCTVSDAMDLASLSSLSFADFWTQSHFEQEIVKENTYLIAALKGTDLIGYLSLSFDESPYITSLAVHPEFRRRGVGTMLLRYLSRDLEEKAIQDIYLEVRKSNLGAQKFYKQHGFVCVLEKILGYQNPSEPGILMKKMIK